MPSTSSRTALAALFAITFVSVPPILRGEDAMDPHGCHEIVGGSCDATWTTVPQPNEH